MIIMPTETQKSAGISHFRKSPEELLKEGILPEKMSSLIELRNGYHDTGTGLREDVYQRFIRRSKFWGAHREFFKEHDFIEINIPMTVEEMVTMGRFGVIGLFHYPGKKDSEIVTQALKHVDMFEYKNHQISDLSGGQQQRVFIARALASEPEIIFLDEPTVGVDIKTQKQFYKLLRKLNRELDMTLILASHELDVVAHESTEIAYINRTLEYYGEPAEFLKGAYFHELIGIGGLHK